MRSQRVTELEALARQEGGQIVASELKAPVGSICVTLAIIPSVDDSPIFAFGSKTEANHFIDKARESGYLALAGNIATTSQLNFIGEGMRAARSLFVRGQG